MYSGSSGRTNADQIYQRNLEDENNKNIELLHQNINELQSIGIEIKDFIINEKKGLNSLENSYDNSRSLMEFTMKKIDMLMGSNYGKVTCYLVLAVIVIFVILFFLKPWENLFYWEKLVFLDLKLIKINDSKFEKK